MSITSTYTVQGMTCEHCVNAVTQELRGLPGVNEVVINLVVGGDSAVEVTSDVELDRTSVERAIDEAGYELQ